MRAFILTLAAACLAVVIGCEPQNNNRELAEAPAPAAAPRVNLYPLTTPPPGSVQPLVGYAPTRITASQYGPEVYRDDAGNVELAARNPQGLNLNMNSLFAPEAPAAPVYADQTVAAVTYPAGFEAGATTYTTTTAYQVAPATTDPYYCPPGAAYCPVPGSPIGATAVATPGASFGFDGAATPSVVYASAPAPVVTTPSYQTPVYQTASYTPPAIAPAPVTPPVYAQQPIRLSATAAYAPPAYTPPAPRAPTPYSTGERSVGLHFGDTEGTADIVGPVPSLNPVVRPAFVGGYSAAPVYGTPAPYVQPLSANTQSAPEEIQAMAAPARRPLLPSSRVSSVAGVSTGASDVSGYRLVPAPDVPPGNHPNDFGPSQWFEVVRPGNGAVRIGRISATCVCVGARIPKRQYAAGERILVEARTLSKPSVNNVTYGLYVNIVEPVETVVDADVTLSY